MEAREYFIINESALELLGFDHPHEAVGAPFELIFGYPEIFQGGSIIGVAEDFHFYTMTERIKPMVMFQKHIWFWNFLIRIDRNNFSDGLEFVHETWERLYPDYSFSYFFVDNLYRDIYSQEIRQAKILGTISVLTMIIACLGLFGLMRYLAGTRTREIGIRKVHGARTFQILLLLNRDFLIMVIMALAIGIPATYLLARSWLQNFVYRTGIQWWMFAIVSLGFLVISMLTISYQSWLAASRNPSKSLRYE
jgi:putative ABC transport system permease protein